MATSQRVVPRVRREPRVGDGLARPNGLVLDGRAQPLAVLQCDPLNRRVAKGSARQNVVLQVVACVVLHSLPQTTAFYLVDHRSQDLFELKVGGAQVFQEGNLLLLLGLCLQVVRVERGGGNVLHCAIGASLTHASLEEVAGDGGQARGGHGRGRGRGGRDGGEALAGRHTLVLDAAHVDADRPLNTLCDRDVRLGGGDHWLADLRVGVPRRRGRGCGRIGRWRRDRIN